MTEDFTTLLCTQCGLCCDGSLFDDVELAGQKEADELEVMGLAIDHDKQPLLLQPCHALNGTTCAIYPFRPGCCRTFECRLLQRTKKKLIPTDEALSIIRKTRSHVARMIELCASLGIEEPELPLKETCIEALSQPTHADDDQANAIRAELAAAMDEMAIIVNEAFLG